MGATSCVVDVTKVSGVSPGSTLCMGKNVCTLAPAGLQRGHGIGGRPWCDRAYEEGRLSSRGSILLDEEDANLVQRTLLHDFSTSLDPRDPTDTKNSSTVLGDSPPLEAAKRKTTTSALTFVGLDI